MATPRAAVHRDVEQRFRDIEAKVRQVLTVLGQRPKFEVTSGDLTLSGGSLVVDGGDVVMLDTDGSTLFKLGPQEFGDRGVSIYRENGTPALEVTKPNVNAVQAWRMKDSSENVILAESGFGAGLGRPRLPSHPFPTSTPAYGAYGPEVSTSSTSWATLFAVHDRRQNPLWCSASGAATAPRLPKCGWFTPLRACP